MVVSLGVLEELEGRNMRAHRDNIAYLLAAILDDSLVQSVNAIQS